MDGFFARLLASAPHQVMSYIRNHHPSRPPSTRGLQLSVLLLAWLIILCGTGCRAPAVRLTTEEPLQVDIAMRVDIYQHARGESTPGATVQRGTPADSPEVRRRNRMADIQELKNSRLVGEGKEGLLVILDAPPGEYGQFVVATVADENADRMAIMRRVAEKTKSPLSKVQRDQAAEWRQRSFTGEWIEIPQEDGQAGEWKQKPGT